MAELKLCCNAGHEFSISDPKEIHRTRGGQPYVVCKHMYPYSRYYRGNEFYSVQKHQCTGYAILTESQVEILSDSSE